MSYTNERQIRFDRNLARLFFATVAIGVFTIGFWALPRDVADIEDIRATEVNLEEMTVRFSGTGTTKRVANSSYERSIQCGPSKYNVNTLQFVTQPGGPAPLDFLIDIPLLVPRGEACTLIIESSHEFNVLFLPKSTSDRWESSSFVIGE